ncbi:MAG: hydrogenase formation protein HypD [bacterium]
MKYIDEFRNKEAARTIINSIRQESGDKQITFMEVCGTHTMSIARFGIRDVLPEYIRLISGPGCPVCVTPNRYIDYAVALSRREDIIVATFGDMMKVPGSSSNLEKEHIKGNDIRVVGSTLEALHVAKENAEKNVIFLGVGFETTVPTVAASLMQAKSENLPNYFVLSAHKTMPEAMKSLSKGDVNIDIFICPGHVSTVIGTEFYYPLVEDYGIGCVVSGFESLDILQSILMGIKQVVNKNLKVENQYTRAVKPEGNPRAREIIYEVFEPSHAEWRGLGVIPNSGLEIRDDYSSWNAEKQFEVNVEATKEAEGCICGQILQGKKIPTQCKNFGRNCVPDNPIGPCMVSSEGTCAAYFKYKVDY